MAEAKGSGDYGAWGKVPTWDGPPRTWRTFRREMSWWMSSLDSSSTQYNLAARWFLRPRSYGKGVKDSVLKSLPSCRPKELTRPQTGEVFEVAPADPFHGFNKLRKAWNP